uniref:Zinc finger BED domain-containing protein 5 n=1 Tax=Cacopsylla melanoneura TaxID=428564 RepID=A0A8D9BHS7_9HEMI
MNDSVEKYFPIGTIWDEKLKCNSWVLSPFNTHQKPQGFTVDQYENFLELTSDSTLKECFKNKCLVDFWCSLSEYNDIAQMAIKLLPFATTYLCEAGFYRNRLDAEPQMKLQCSNISPNIKQLCAAKQHHSSHF